MDAAAQVLGLGLRGPAAAATSEVAAAARRGARASRLRARRGRAARSRLEDIELRPPRIEPPALARAHLRHRPLRARHALLRKGVSRHRPRASGAGSTTRPTSSRAPRDEARRRASCSPGARRRARRRSRSAAARAWSAASSRRRRRVRAVSIDLGALDRVLEVDEVSRAARIQAGRARAGARGPAPRARPHAAPLPAVVRVLDARRLDRHARGRPLRDAVHPHRRPRRVGARGDAARASGRAGDCPARAPARARTGC